MRWTPRDYSLRYEFSMQTRESCMRRLQRAVENTRLTNTFFIKAVLP